MESYDKLKAQKDAIVQREKDALALRWSKDKPTKPGWYWWRPEDNGLNPLIVWVSTEGVVLFVNFAPSRVDEMGGQFAGPLPLPMEGGGR